MLMKSPRSKISLARVRRQRARELPLRAELFGIEQLARHAQFIAAQHTIVTGRASARLLTRLDQNEKELRAFNRATLAVARKLVAYLMAVDKSGKPFQVRASAGEANQDEQPVG